MNFAVFLVIGLPIAGILFLLFDKRMRRQRMIQSLPEKSAEEVKEGEYVKFKGVVAGKGRKIKAPISGRECYAYKIWVTEGAEVSTVFGTKVFFYSVDFILTTDDGEVVVLCEGAILDMDHKNHLIVGGDFSLLPNVHQFLEANDLSSHQTKVFQEARLEEGDSVLVSGYAYKGPQGWILENGKDKEMLISTKL